MKRVSLYTMMFSAMLGTMPLLAETSADSIRKPLIISLGNFIGAGYYSFQNQNTLPSDNSIGAVIGAEVSITKTMIYKLQYIGGYMDYPAPDSFDNKVRLPVTFVNISGIIGSFKTWRKLYYDYCIGMSYMSGETFDFNSAQYYSNSILEQRSFNKWGVLFETSLLHRNPYFCFGIGFKGNINPEISYYTVNFIIKVNIPTSL